MNISFLKNNDAKLLSQAADPVLRKDEIERLSRSRRGSLLAVTVFCVLLLVNMIVFPSQDGSWFYAFAVLAFFAQFYELQNRLRLLLLAEQLYARQTWPVVGAP